MPNAAFESSDSKRETNDSGSERDGHVSTDYSMNTDEQESSEPMQFDDLTTSTESQIEQNEEFEKVKFRR